MTIQIFGKCDVENIKHFNLAGFKQRNNYELYREYTQQFCNTKCIYYIKWESDMRRVVGGQLEVVHNLNFVYCQLVEPCTSLPNGKLTGFT